MTPRSAAGGRSLLAIPAVRPTRAARGAATALLVAAALAGCQLASPIQTDEPYNAADGVPVDLGSVQIRDLVVVAEKKGGPGTLSGSLINTSGTTQQVTFSDGQGQATAEARPYSQEPLSGEQHVVLPAITGEPGGVVRLSVATVDAGTNVVEVPVLLAHLYYSTLAPTVTSTSQTPSATASSSESPTQTSTTP